MSENNNENKKKKSWILIICILILNLIFLGLLIWGIVVLCLWSSYKIVILGGLLVGLNSFFIIFSGINLSSYIINNPNIKKEFIDYFKSKFRKKNNEQIIKEEIKC